MIPLLCFLLPGGLCDPERGYDKYFAYLHTDHVTDGCQRDDSLSQTGIEEESHSGSLLDLPDTVGLIIVRGVFHGFLQ